MTNDSEKNNDVIRRLDIISIFLLAQKGLSQKQIARILGVGDNRIQELFGEHYTKIQPEKSESNSDKNKSKNKKVKKNAK